MKFFHPMLLAYLARKIFWPTLIGATALALYELFPSIPLTGREGLPAMFILIHVTWISWAVSRMGKGEMPFLYTRGFRWDMIWWHRVAVALLPVGVAVGTAWAVLALGCRTVVQVGMENSLYPLVARREIWVPMQWLALYAIFLPVGLYAFARADHEGPLAGLWLAIAVGITTLFGWNLPPWVARWVPTALEASTGVMIVTLLCVGQFLHREAEVT